MAQVSTRPTSGAEEFARIAGKAIATMVRCGCLACSVKLFDCMDGDSCDSAAVIITMCFVLWVYFFEIKSFIVRSVIS